MKAYHWQAKVDKRLRGHIAEVESTCDDVNEEGAGRAEASGSKVLEL
jgi:hypothetical protein